VGAEGRRGVNNTLHLITRKKIRTAHLFVGIKGIATRGAEINTNVSTKIADAVTLILQCGVI
jgi:hypothetical protein